MRSSIHRHRHLVRCFLVGRAAFNSRASPFQPSTVDEHAPTPSTKFDEDYISAPFAAFPRVTDTLRRSYVFLALSRPFHSILQHIHIILPFSKYSTRSRLQRLHRFAEARPFVTLLYLDARIHPRIASAAFAVFVLHFISHLHPVTGSPFVFILHTNYYTQSSYKNTVEILCTKKKQEDYALISSYLSFAPSSSY